MNSNSSVYKLDCLFALTVIIGSLAGYFLVSAFASAFGVSGTNISISVRVLVVLAAVAVLSKYISFDIRRYPILLFILLFWFFYVIRISIDTLVYSDFLSQPVIYYWTFGIGACFLPMLAIVFSPRLDGDVLHLRIYIACLLAGVMAVVYASTFSESYSSGVFEDTGRLRLDALNPISLGNLGCLLVLQALWYLAVRRSSLVKSMFFFFGLSIGLYLLVASNSRGPLLALLVGLLFFAFLMPRRLAFFYLIVLVLLFFVFSWVLYFLGENYGFGIYDRMFSQNIVYDESSLARQFAYAESFRVFFDKPLTGDGLELIEIRSYPHNIVLESFVSTGLVGGIIFVIVIFSVLMKAIRLFESANSFSWASLLFVQFLVAAQFSGSLINSTSFWVSLGLICYADIWLNRSPNR